MRPLSTTEAVQILGLDGPVDAGAVKRAYRELARQHHPDRGGDAGTFQRVQAAYDVLRDQLPDLGDLRGRRRDPVTSASVADRWWESPSRWHEAPVDVGSVDWDVEPPGEGRAYALSRDLLAVRLAAPSDGPVSPVVARSRAPGSWLHRVIGWLQPDLLAELRAGVAGTAGIADHDVEVRLTFRSLKARRIVNDAPLPQGWIKHRGSSSTTIHRLLHPSLSRDATAVRVADLVAEMTDAAGWPLEDWYVVAD